MFTKEELVEMKYIYENRHNTEFCEKFFVSSATLTRIKREHGWVKKRKQKDEIVVIPEFTFRPKKKLTRWPKGFNAILGYAY